MFVQLHDMRSCLSGLILLLSCAPLLGQPAEGDVESIGFDGFFRPNACVPMKLRLRPKIGTPATYKLAVLQEDMDGDRVLYSRPFTLNGNPDGGRLEEKVWVYFIPQPRELRDAKTPPELKNILRIFLCTPSGRQLTQIDILPGTPMPKDIDDPRINDSKRGTRLILTVGNSQSRPFRSIYQLARGVLEDAIFQPVSIADLPESSLGYQAVDAIVWLNADPADLAAKPDTSAAIQEYVRNGGNLVVCQNPLAWQKTMDSPLGDLIPVLPTAVEDEKGLASLRRLAELPDPKITTDPKSGKIINVQDPWSDTVDRSAPIVRAAPKPGAFVNLYQASDPKSPYLARWMVGLGAVIWTAQDFGDPTVQSATANRYAGWARIWDRTFDWRNRTITPDIARSDAERRAETVYRETGAATDLSKPLAGGMEATHKGVALVALAMIFFVAYWLAAGPGSYFLLLAKKRAHLSWIAFGAAAVVATALTLLIVKLVLRGPPELYHVSIVRVSPQSDAVIHSQFGLYIKRDGIQRIVLKESDPKRESYIIPYPDHPDQNPIEKTGFTAYLEYEVPMRDRNSGEPPAIEVPYRSTLKKFRAQWVGRFPGNITGSARIIDGRLAGRLTNNTGVDLHNVYLAFAPTPAQGQGQDDLLIEIPDTQFAAAWPKGAIWDLADIMSQLRNQGIEIERPGTIGARGRLNGTWLAKNVKGNWVDNQLAGRLGGIDLSQDDKRVPVLLSLFDRLEPTKNAPGPNSANDRFELLRRSARHMDASAAVSTGHLLVLATSGTDNRAPVPLPFPLQVEEATPTVGRGAIFYQFVVPMERSGTATQPAETPAD